MVSTFPSACTDSTSYLKACNCWMYISTELYLHLILNHREIKNTPNSSGNLYLNCTVLCNSLGVTHKTYIFVQNTVKKLYVRDLIDSILNFPMETQAMIELMEDLWYVKYCKKWMFIKYYCKTVVCTILNNVGSNSFIKVWIINYSSRE